MKRILILALFLLTVSPLFAQRPTGQVVSGSTTAGSNTPILVDSTGVVSVNITGSTGASQITPNLTYPTAFGIAIASLGATSGTVATATTTLIGTLFCQNITSGAITLDVTNTAGTAIVKAFSVPANSNLTLNYYSGLLAVGVKWWASAISSLNCSLTGWQ